MEEESFPRGGLKSKPDAKEKSPKKRKLNEEPGPGDSKVKKQRKERRRKEKDGNDVQKQKKHKIEGEVTGQGSQLHPQYLSKKFLYPGMLLLGCVKQIKNYSLVIALPNGLSGSVPITHISQAYTDSLQRYSEAEDQNAESVSTLSELFKTGMLVACKLTECDDSQDKKTLTLSIDPKVVNSDLSAANLRNGMCLFGTVASQEDHGYIIDIGMKGVQAFLKNKHAQRYISLHNEGCPLRVGQCMLCKMQMKGGRMAVLAGQNRVINITIDPVELKNIEISEGLDLSFSSLLPGMRLHAKVERIVKDDGIVVQFHKFRGVIHKSHLPRLPKTYTHGEEVVCSVLYIHPLVKIVTLTMLSHLTDYMGVPINVFGEYKVGDVVEGATVKRTDKKRGVYLSLPNGATGFAGLSNLSDEGVQDIQAFFKKGSTHRCRVLGFYPMEAQVIVTLKKSMIDEKFIRIADIQPGDIVECKMEKLGPKGMSVKVFKKIAGIIPTVHLADVTLKHPEQKFKPDEKLKCRVLFVNKKHSKLTLTHKKSLVNSKYPVVSSYEQVEVGQILEGFVDVVKDFGCIVRFYNNIRGLVPRAYLSTEEIQYPEKVFYVGQVVRCKVISVDPPDEKLRLSFVLEGKVEFGKKTKEVPTDFKLGKHVTCKVTKKTKTGLDVELSPSGVQAFLPKMHLSDSQEMCDVLLNMYRPGDTIGQAMYWSLAKTPVVTCKPCLLASGHEEEEFVSSFDSLQPGMMVPGAVRNLQSYGIFVEFAGKLFGLVPRQYAADRHVQDLEQLYHRGQTVVAKVMEVNKDKQRFLASLRMQDCYHGNTQIGIDLTWNYLQQKQKVLEKMTKTQGGKGELADLKLGSIHTVTVKQVTVLGAFCELDNGIKAVVIKENISGPVRVGDKVSAVVLFVDIAQNCVEVSMSENLLKLIRFHQEDQKAKPVTEQQIVKCRILLVKEDVVIVCVSTGHCKGTLAYLPAKRHWNDVLERHQYTVGQENKVVVKRIEGDLILMSLKVHEDRQEEEEELGQVSDHQFQQGDICSATVRHVYKDCLHISIGRTCGRVYVTEMVDEVKNGTSPTSGYKRKEEIQVRVIGFRDSKAKSYLPISHPNLKTSLPDCTMKPSLLSMKKLPEGYINNRTKFQLGDKVIAAVENISGQYLWTCIYPGVQGKVHVFNLSTDVKKLNAPHLHFLQGQCYNATVISVINKQLLELSFLDHPWEVQAGRPTIGIIRHKKKDIGLDLQLPEGIQGTVHLTDFLDDYKDDPTERFKIGEVITATVVSVQKLSKEAVVSLRPAATSGHLPKDPRINSVKELKPGKVLRGYIIRASRNGIVVSLGAGISGFVAPDHIVEGKLVSKVSNHFKKATVVTVKVLEFDDTNQLHLSMLKKDTGVKITLNPRYLHNIPEEGGERSVRKRSISQSSADSDSEPTKKTKLKNIEMGDVDESIELEISDIQEPQDSSNSEDDEIVSSTSGSTAAEDGPSNKPENETDDIDVEADVVGVSSETLDKYWEKLRESSDSDLDDSTVKTKNVKKKKVTKKVLDDTSASDSETVSESASKVKRGINGKTDDLKLVSHLSKVKSVTSSEESDVTLKQSKEKRKREKKKGKDILESPQKKNKMETELLQEDNVSSTVEVKVVSKPDVELAQKPVLEISEGFSWDTDFHLPALTSGDISSEDSDDDDTQKPVKKTREQLRMERIEEEKRLYQSEMQRLEGDVQPQTADDFDRLVLQSPDSSLVWLRYMAFHLETTEIDKARAIAERALKTISFREEQEKLNVWVAYLNLENMYGTAESVRKVLARAVQQSDEVKVYYQMVNIYVKSGKIEEAEQLFNTLVKKYNGDKEVWIKFAKFYFQNNRVESARKLLQRCLKSLETKFHLDTLTKFAQFEFKHGEPERGKTMFENILSTYPKRTDLWSVYIDMVTKLGELEATRSLYNRVLTHKMSMKKMKFFFKKYLEFEEKHGTPDRVADVKKKALQYVESQGYVDE